MKTTFKDNLNLIKKEEYNEIKDNLKFNFGIEIPLFEDKPKIKGKLLRFNHQWS